MVRVYRRKTFRGWQDSIQDIDNAIKEVEGGRPILSAAKKYNIPLTTLYQYIKGRRKIKSQGPLPVLPKNIENELVVGIKTMEKWGFGLTLKEVLEIVRKFVTSNKLKAPFENNLPGEVWFINFKKRHHLSLKKPQALEYARKKALDPFSISEYFDLLNSTLTSNELVNTADKIFNLDEASFCLDPSKTKVVGEKNSPSARITSGPGKGNRTVVFVGNAAGEKLPLMIIFKSKFMWDQWMAPSDKAFPNTAYAATKNGWMESDVFLNYIRNTFIPNLKNERPILLIYDGHITHLDTQVIQCCIENKIIILKLPPHSSHLLQPLDLSVFKSLKSKWDSKLVAWQRTHLGQKLPKQEFAVMVGLIWSELDAEVIRNGFRKRGILPFDRNVISNDRYDPAALERWQRHQENLMNEQGVGSTSEIQPSTSHAVVKVSEPSIHEYQVTFEKLMLDKIQQEKLHQKKKKRIAAGAEVITTELMNIQQPISAVDTIDKFTKNDIADNSTKSNRTKEMVIKKKKRNPSTSESELDSTSLSLHDSLSLYSFNNSSDEEVMNLSSADNLNSTSISRPEDIIINDFVIVRLQYTLNTKKKSDKWYIAHVIKKLPDGCDCSFMRHSTKVDNAFLFPNIEDRMFVKFENIMQRLKPPSLRRGRYDFDEKLLFHTFL